MHTCPPPMSALDEWLERYPSVRRRYGHLLIEQRATIRRSPVDALRPYFESAHLDAREYFHAQIGISLHPDATSGPLPVSYPNCLPSKAHRGLFGEVIAGLITEAYQADFVGGHAWRVPIFLFRDHDDVEKYLWTLRFSPTQKREIYGRHGTDFIGIAMDADGAVNRVIAGEAKWRASLTDSVVENLLLGPLETDEDTGEREHNGRGIWSAFNRDTPLPHGLRQLQRLLEDRDPDAHAMAILSIDRAVLGQGTVPQRTNLVVIVGNGGRRREAGTSFIDWETAPAEYTAPHDLQVVEMILRDGGELIDELYASLWQTVNAEP